MGSTPGRSTNRSYDEKTACPPSRRPPSRTGFSRFPSDVADDFSPRRKTKANTSAQADVGEVQQQSLLRCDKKPSRIEAIAATQVQVAPTLPTQSCA